MNRAIRKLLLAIPFVLLMTVASFACVRSNLDNAFDPTTVPGIIVGFAINGAGGSTSSDSSSSSGSPSVSVCSDVTPTVVDFTTIGTTTYAVPASTQYVYMRVIGAGGGGGWFNTASCGAAGEFNVDALASSVKIQGAGSNLLEATGGTTGTCGSPAGQGIGGTGGTPNGINGTSGSAWPANVTPPGGTHAFHWGSGHAGSPDMAVTTWGAGGGGAGGYATGTYSELAGQTLEITVGRGGYVDFSGTVLQQGTKGNVQLTLF